METKIDGSKKNKAIQYYDNISGIYDYISNWYYKKARKYTISDHIIGFNLSNGMTNQEQENTNKNGWTKELLKNNL